MKTFYLTAKKTTAGVIIHAKSLSKLQKRLGDIVLLVNIKDAIRGK